MSIDEETKYKTMFSIRTSIEEWKTTVWSNIDVENMDMECKKFAKVIRSLILSSSTFLLRMSEGLTRQCVHGMLITDWTQR